MRATPAFIELAKNYPMGPNRESATGRAILERRVVHIPDRGADPEYRWAGPQGAEDPYPTILAVPMLREATVIGVIALLRSEVHPFSDRQIELVTTFADQAVIAIENVRLFRELEGRNRELTEALEQQTATGEVLRVISQSPMDVQPVFDAIARSAVRLCDAVFCGLARFDGELLHMVAHHGIGAEGLAVLREVFPMSPHRGQLVGRAILDRAVVHVPDLWADPDYNQRVARVGGWRSMLVVPLFRDGRPIGAISVARTDPGRSRTRRSGCSRRSVPRP